MSGLCKSINLVLFSGLVVVSYILVDIVIINGLINVFVI